MRDRVWTSETFDSEKLFTRNTKMSKRKKTGIGISSVKSRKGGNGLVKYYLLLTITEYYCLPDRLLF